MVILVLQETKAYIGGDEKFEEIQKLRGFKSYRELYTKKITEQENLGEMLRNTQKDVKVYIPTSTYTFIYIFIHILYTENFISLIY